MKKIAVAFALVMLASCATPPSINITLPKNISKDKISSVEKGVTTIDELTKLFGAPEMTLPGEEGRNAGYFYKDMNLSSLWAEVDDNGIVVDYIWSE